MTGSAIPSASHADLDAQPAGVPSLQRVFRRRFWLIGILTVLGLILGLVYYTTAPPQFESTTLLLVVKRTPDSTVVESLEGQQVASSDYLSTHILLLQSPLIIGRAVESGRLSELESMQIAGDPVTEIIDNLRVIREIDTSHSGGAANVLRVSLVMPYADDCVTILNALVASYVEFLDETYQDVSAESWQFVTNAADRVKGELEEKQRGYLELLKSNPASAGPAADGTAQRLELAETLSLRTSLAKDQLDVESQIAILRSALSQDLPEDALQIAQLSLNGDSDRVKPEEQELMKLLLQREEMGLTHGAEHPRRLALEQQIRYLQSAGVLTPSAHGDATLSTEDDGFRKTLEGTMASLELRLEALKQQQAELARSYEEQKQVLRQSSERDVELQTARDDIDRTARLYNELVGRLQDVDLARDSGGYTTRIIAPAKVAEKIAPDIVAIVPLSLLAGLFAGFAVAFGVDLADRGFRDAEDLRTTIGASLVGKIPPFRIPKARSDSDSGINPAVVAYHGGGSEGSEAFRNLRTWLFFSQRTQGRKVIHVSSPQTGDGKTTVAANLATSIALSGKRVLLIDADFRNPGQHDLFALSNDVGLSSVICGDAEFTEAVQDAKIDHLSLLTSGPVPANPSELLLSDLFGDLLEGLRAMFDFVLIDSPPILSVADAGAIAAKSDATLLVARLDKTSRAATIQSLDELSMIRANLLGVVVNFCPDDRDHRYTDRHHQTRTLRSRNDSESNTAKHA